MRAFYYDKNSILVINPKGRMRKLYCPFRVYPIANSAKPAMFAKSHWVYVQEVHQDKIERLLFLINGKLHPYHEFFITIKF